MLPRRRRQKGGSTVSGVTDFKRPSGHQQVWESLLRGATLRLLSHALQGARNGAFHGLRSKVLTPHSANVLEHRDEQKQLRTSAWYVVVVMCWLGWWRCNLYRKVRNVFNVLVLVCASGRLGARVSSCRSVHLCVCCGELVELCKRSAADAFGCSRPAVVLTKVLVLIPSYAHGLEMSLRQGTTRHKLSKQPKVQVSWYALCVCHVVCEQCWFC